MDQEKRIIQQAQNGEKNAFRQLVDAHKKRVYYLAYDLTGNHQDAEDLSQEVFMKAYKSLSKFRGESKFSSWLHRITVNLFIDMKRSKQYKTKQTQDQFDEQEIEMKTNVDTNKEFSSEAKTEAALLQQNIQHALNNLSPKEKSVFVMRHFNGLKNREIGESLNISVGTVKSQLFRAVKKLQKSLEFYRYEFGLEDSK